MDLLFASLFTAPATFIVWIIYFFLMRKSKPGKIAYWTSFSIYLIIAIVFFTWMTSETGFLAGLGPLLIGCATVSIYSIIAFFVLSVIRRNSKLKNNR